MAGKRKAQAEPTHEAVVSTLLEMQAQLRQGSAVSTKTRDAEVIDLTGPELVRVPDADLSGIEARVSDTVGRIAAMQARIDRLEAELDSLLNRLGKESG